MGNLLRSVAIGAVVFALAGCASTPSADPAPSATPFTHGPGLLALFSDLSGSTPTG